MSLHLVKKFNTITIIILLLISLVFIFEFSRVQSQTEPPTNGDWVISDTTVKHDVTIQLNGNLTVKNGGNLTLDGVELIINSTYDGEFGIFVENGGELHIYDSVVQPYNNSYHFKFKIHGKLVMNSCDVGYFWGVKTPLTYLGGFELYSDDVIIKNSRIHHGEWNGVVISAASPALIGNQIDSNTNTGIYIYDVEDLIFVENDISDNNCGILLESSNATIDNCEIKNNNIGIHFGPFTSPTIENCTLSNYEYDYYLMVSIFLPIPIEEIYPVSLNTTFNQTKVLIMPGNVSLTTQWYLNVNVIDGHGYPLPDANVIVIDKFDQELFNGTPNSEGKIEWLRCTEYIQNSTTRTNYTAHKAFAEYYELIAYANPEPLMDASKYVTISFAPLIPPEIPTGLNAIPTPDNKSINLTWDPNTELDLSHYNLYASLNNLMFSPLASVPKGTEQYFHNEVYENQTYYYIISATDIYSLSSNFSEPVDVIISYNGGENGSNGPNGTNGSNVGGDNLWLSPPENLKVTVIVTGNKLNISWDENLQEELHHYTLYRCVKNQPFVWLINIPKGREYFIDTNLVDGNRYYYVTTSVASNMSESTPSEIVEGVPRDTVAPQTPSGLKAKLLSDKTTIMINWNEVTDKDLEYYYLYLSTDGINFNWLVNVKKGLFFYLHEGLSLGSYYYKISAVDEVPNESPISAATGPIEILEQDSAVDENGTGDANETGEPSNGAGGPNDTVEPDDPGDTTEGSEQSKDSENFTTLIIILIIVVVIILLLLFAAVKRTKIKENFQEGNIDPEKNLENIKVEQNNMESQGKANPKK